MADRTTSLPSGVRVHGLDFQKPEKGTSVARMALTGTARNRDALRSFITALEAQSAVQSVDAPISNFLADKDIVFRITVIFRS